jgi:uncharacterized protein (TIGR02757 family)
LEFPHRYKDKRDIEISAFLSSVFAYGNMKQIISTLEKIHSVMKPSPIEFIGNYDYKEGLKIFKNLKHRFYTDTDIASLFYCLREVYNYYGSLKYLFLLYYFEKDENLKNSIHFFSKRLTEITSKKNGLTNGIKFMFPDPNKGSACKRINLFLRWMIRNDELDFGLWSEIPPSKLVIPVDTHVAKICSSLKLTKRKSISWAMAEEITNKLKKFNPADPVKYDFAICHIGIRKLIF